MSKQHMPIHWNTARLEDVCFKPEYGLTASAMSEPVGPKFLRITDLQDGRVRWEVVPYTTCEPEVLERYRLAPGDIVIARIGATTGKAFLLENCPDAIYASYLIRIRTKPLLSPDFLGFFCLTQAYWRQIDQNKGGRLKSGINIPILQNLTLPLPPLPEQRAIARALRAVQQAKESRRREAALERERKAALMEHLFTHGIRGEATKQTEIGEMPASWRLVRLGEFTDILQYGTSQRCDADESGFPVLRIPNVISGKIDYSELKFTKFTATEAESLTLRRGDLLFVRTNGRREYVGRCAMFGDESRKMLLASYLIRARLKPGELLPESLSKM